MQLQTLASLTLVLTLVCVTSLGLEGSCASAQGHSPMGRDANIVSRRFGKLNFGPSVAVQT